MDKRGIIPHDRSNLVRSDGREGGACNRIETKSYEQNARDPPVHAFFAVRARRSSLSWMLLQDRLESGIINDEDESFIQLASSGFGLNPRDTIVSRKFPLWRKRARWVSTANPQSLPATRHIELNLREVDQLFNTMDPSPFHEKIWIVTRRSSS
jgi:hypothetical protein